MGNVSKSHDILFNTPSFYCLSVLALTEPCLLGNFQIHPILPYITLAFLTSTLCRPQLPKQRYTGLCATFQMKKAVFDLWGT